MKIYHVFWILFTILPSAGSSQVVKAVADYEQTYRMGFGFNGRQLTDEQRERIAGRLESMPAQKYRLTMVGNRSAYEFVGPASEERSRWGVFLAGSRFKDAKAITTVNRVEVRDTVYLVQDTLAKIDWELHDETMEIGPLLVYKATAVLLRNGGGSFMPGGGRGEVPERMEVVAWYCPEIDSNQGPGRYWGLPGLILEVEEPNAIISCVNIELFPPGLDAVVFPEDGTYITGAVFAGKLRRMREERRKDRPNRN